MEWRDQGVLLSVRRHGESAAIIEMFTARHGRHAGVVRGGGGRRMAPVLQPGAQLDVTWRARLEGHIGSYTVEPLRQRAAAVLHDRAALLALSSVCSLLAFVLPERDPHSALYAASVAVLDALCDTPDGWQLAYLRWEMLLLEESGFGLELGRCAVTGRNDDLAFVSPRTGRAVSTEGAGDWADRLLPLPDALLRNSSANAQDLAAGLRVTGHFMDAWLAPALGDKPLPAARQRLIDHLVAQRTS